MQAVKNVYIHNLILTLFDLTDSTGSGDEPSHITRFMPPDTDQSTGMTG
jgi:hypothetical protein